MFNTNLLWLKITNIVVGVAYANLYNATNQVYTVLTSTNLTTPSSNCQVATEVFPTSTNCTPFVVQTLNQNTLFLRAEDWTGVTDNGNLTPEWWFWYYYGTNTLSDTNLDSQGLQLSSDYWAGTDPNLIDFSVAVTNNYLNSASVPLQINVTAGVPFYITTLFDNTNFAGATWSAYTSSNITVNVGSVAGWHNVWVGLRGFPAKATQTRQCKHFDLTTPPVLAITNPTIFVVNKPVIQVYGFSQEPLSTVSYAISNALGDVKNQPSDITDQYFDTNTCNFTTNYFECLDVPLTNGLNILTLQATDLSGNTTITNFNFTLDYSSKTNPPSLQISWPQNGSQVSGNTITLQGTIGDPTAFVTTQLIITNSNTNLSWAGIYTNLYVASVERNGNFWLENLPLNSGTNVFAITVEDVVGNTFSTNINIVHSTLTLTINPVTPDSQLWQPTVNLTGSISITNDAVWVNGVKGHNNGDGTWYANIVPVNEGGTATFTATAYGPTERQPDGSYGN